MPYVQGLRFGCVSTPWLTASLAQEAEWGHEGSNGASTEHGGTVTWAPHRGHELAISYTHVNYYIIRGSLKSTPQP